MPSFVIPFDLFESTTTSTISTTTKSSISSTASSITSSTISTMIAPMETSWLDQSLIKMTLALTPRNIIFVSTVVVIILIIFISFNFLVVCLKRRNLKRTMNNKIE